MTRHYESPLAKARFWLSKARRAIELGDPVLAVGPSHDALHNAIVALRNYLSEERGKILHSDVRRVAVRFGVPRALADGVDEVERLKAPFGYGTREPTEEDGRRFHAVAEEAVAYVEGVVSGRRGKRPGRVRRPERPES